MYEKRRYTPEELERGRYATEKIVKLISKLPFSVMFDSLAGVLVGWAANNDMSLEEVIERIRYLARHDSPDGRTSDELIAAFKKGGTAS